MRKQTDTGDPFLLAEKVHRKVHVRILLPRVFLCCQARNVYQAT
ncbi:uncharacterized protein METZ01_LOCUS68657 [marine metagenome]|uniref:Uncharacterized protein n=1 Tax=marine metagenome TaxID=408172 RepID=A0A381TP23_9ZZZZ